jgi:Holliday junction resolvase RusA-like endonuclease
MRGEKLLDVYVMHRIFTYYEPEWEKLMQEAIWKQLKVKRQLDMNMSVRLEFFLTKNRYDEGKLDLDNMIKTVIDSLNANENDARTQYPIYDDSWISNIEATKISTEEQDLDKEKMHVEIWKWNE